MRFARSKHRTFHARPPNESKIESRRQWRSSRASPHLTHQFIPVGPPVTRRNIPPPCPALPSRSPPPKNQPHVSQSPLKARHGDVVYCKVDRRAPSKSPAALTSPGICDNSRETSPASQYQRRGIVDPTENEIEVGERYACVEFEISPWRWEGTLAFTVPSVIGTDG